MKNDVKRKYEEQRGKCERRERTIIGKKRKCFRIMGVKK